MAKLHFLFLLSLSICFTFSLAFHSDLPFGYLNLPLTAASHCRGTVGECLAGSTEGELAADVSTRRFLAGLSRYISYGALRRDTVPCDRRGASYYNCRPGANANPYSRGCSTITRCRG